MDWTYSKARGTLMDSAEGMCVWKGEEELKNDDNVR